MNSGRFFWGAFLVGLGVLMLLQRVSTLVLDWAFLWRFWPLILVFWGGAVLLRGSRLAPAAAVMAGMTLAVILAALLDLGFSWDGTGTTERQVRTQDFVQPYGEGVRRGSFNLDAGTGSYSIDGTTEHLAEAIVRSESGRYVMRGERTEQSEDVSLKLEGERREWAFSRAGNRVMLRFHAGIPWDMHFRVGASRLDLDLSPLVVERIAIKAGASQVRIRLGERAEETHVSFASGVSSVRILVPRGSACEIRAVAPLSRKSFKDFSRSSEGTYRTENFTSASHKVFLSLESGISNLTVVRY